MTDLERLLRVEGAPPDHAPGFEARLWRAIRSDGRREDEKAADRVAAIPVAGRRRTRLLAVLAAAAAIVAVAVGLVVTRHDVQEYAHPPAASAAQVAANVRDTLASIRTLTADFTDAQRHVTGPPRSEWRDDWTTADWWSRARIGGWLPSTGKDHVVVSGDGLWRLVHPEGPGAPEIVDRYTADEAAGVMKTYWPADRTLYVTGEVSLGAPDSFVGTYAVGWSVVVNFIRGTNLAVMATGQVGETVYEGRPALTVRCSIPQVSIKGLDIGSHLFDAVEYTVDRESWLVVRTDFLLRGEVVQRYGLSNVRLNEPLPAGTFDFSPPPGTTTKDVGQRENDPADAPLFRSLFRRVTFADAGGVWPTTPLAPSRVPAGFAPFAAAVAPDARWWIWTFTQGYRPSYWPPSKDITQLCYRTGLLRFLVTTRAQPSGGPLPSDLFVADPFVTETAGDDIAAIGANVGTVTLTGGVWRGVTAYLVVPPLAPPHLWAWHDGVLVTVGGDLTRDELLAVANSLQPMK
jgi:hypothetical protein